MNELIEAGDANADDDGHDGDYVEVSSLHKSYYYYLSLPQRQSLAV